MRLQSLVLAVSSSLFVFSAASCSCTNAPFVDDGGTGGGGSACRADAGCTAASMPACDPAGSDQLGTCVDVGGGCLKVQSLSACPSTLQTCVAGTNSCACPASACTPGSATSCASA